MAAGLNEFPERRALFEKLLMLLIVICFAVSDFILYSNNAQPSLDVTHMLARLAGLGTLLTIALIAFYLIHLPRSSYYYFVFAGFLIVYFLNIYSVFVSPMYNSSDKQAYQEIILGLFRSLVWISGGVILIAEGGRGIHKSEIFRIFSISFGAFICINMLDQYSYLLFDSDPYQYIRYLFYIFMPLVFMLIFILNKSLRMEYSESAVKMISFMFLLFSLATITFLIQFLFYEG
jgi:hypothetical protein